MSTMPAELGEVFRGFFQEYSIIRVKWRLYKQLFGDIEGIDLLNRHGAHGFGVVQDVIIKDVILCITRMMNTSKEAWGDPANLATLLIDLVAHKQAVLADKLRAIRDTIKPVVDGLSRWRDVQISRNDYASFVNMKAGIDALPPPSRQMVEDILSAMGRILDELRRTTPAWRGNTRTSPMPASSRNSCPTSETSRGDGESLALSETRAFPKHPYVRHTDRCYRDYPRLDDRAGSSRKQPGPRTRGIRPPPRTVAARSAHPGSGPPRRSAEALATATGRPTAGIGFNGHRPGARRRSPFRPRSRTGWRIPAIWPLTEVRKPEAGQDWAIRPADPRGPKSGRFYPKIRPGRATA